MNVGKRYVLDANVFIQAYRRYYAFDICPGFWAAISRQFEFGKVCSIDRVRDELVGEEDQLTGWVKENLPKEFFRQTADERVIITFGELVNWLQAEEQYTQDAKAEFADVADGWIVAFAKVNKYVVVTHEQYAPEARKTVKIPNLCIEFGVEYCTTFEMLRGLKEQFILKTRRKKS